MDGGTGTIAQGDKLIQKQKGTGAVPQGDKLMQQKQGAKMNFEKLNVKKGQIEQKEVFNFDQMNVNKGDNINKARSNTSIEPVIEVDVEDHTVKSPDGGWGWMVVLGCVLMRTIVGGITRSSGLFYVKFLDKFDGSAAETAWVTSLSATCRLLVGPIVSLLCNRLSCRKLTYIGAALYILGLHISGYADSLLYLYLSYGALAGIGRGFLLTPITILLGEYFHTRRSLAFGIASAGFGLGGFVITPVIELLFQEYGFTGTYILISGFACHLFICVALFRPVESRHTKSFPERTKDIDSEPDSDADVAETEPLVCQTVETVQHGGNTPGNGNEKSDIEENQRQERATAGNVTEKHAIEEQNQSSEISHNVNEPHAAEGSHNDKDTGATVSKLSTESDSQMAPEDDNNDAERRPMVNSDGLQIENGMNARYRDDSFVAVDSDTNMETNPDHDGEDSTKILIGPGRDGGVSTKMATKAMLDEGGDIYMSTNSKIDDEEMLTGDTLQNNSHSEDGGDNVTMLNGCGRSSKAGVSDTDYTRQSIGMSMIQENEMSISERADMGSMSMLDHDFLSWTSSGTNIDTNGARNGIKTMENSPTNSVSRKRVRAQRNMEVNSDKDANGLQNNMGNGSIATKTGQKGKKKMFSCSVFKDVRFMTLCLATFIFTLPTSGLFLPALAKSRGLSDIQAAYLLSIIAGCDTVSRVISGFVLDLKRVRSLRPYIYNGVSFMQCVALFLLPSMNTFGEFATVCCLHGAVMGVKAAQRSVILVDILGVDKLASSFAILLACQGIGTLVGPTVSGYLKDRYGKYDYTFYFGGSAILVGAIILATGNIRNFYNTKHQAQRDAVEQKSRDVSSR